MVTVGAGSTTITVSSLSSNLQKGEIIVERPNKPAKSLPFLFNPASYKVSKGAEWSANEGADGDNAQRWTFKSIESAKLDVTLFFDTYESGKDVRDYTNLLFDLVKVDPSTKTATQKARPPFCRFQWGLDSKRNTSFKAFVTNVDVTFSLFLMNGTPVRAEAGLALQEVLDNNVGQNPTTQGTYGNQVHLVKPGESLSLIAYMYYGSSNEWRTLADANRLIDPLSLKPGQALEIVPIEVN